MKKEEVKILLEKYFEGETSLQEEILLSEYFNGENVDTELTSYRPMFQFFKVEKDVKLSSAATDNILKISKNESKIVELSTSQKGSGARSIGLWWRAAAAIMVLGVSTFLISKQFDKGNSKCVAQDCRVKIYDENDDPQKALEEVEAALKLVSKKMRKGTDETTKSLEKVGNITNDVDKIIQIE